MSNDDRMKILRKFFDSETASFTPLVDQAANERKVLQKEVSDLLRRNGVILGEESVLQFKVKGDGIIPAASWTTYR